MLGRQPRRRLGERGVAARRLLRDLALAGDPLPQSRLDGNRALFGDQLRRMAEALDSDDARHFLREQRRIAQPDIAAERMADQRERRQTLGEFGDVEHIALGRIEATRPLAVAVAAQVRREHAITAGEGLPR